MNTATRNSPSTMTGTRMFIDSVYGPSINSQPGGASRRAPSAKPMYQSGWVPADTGEGSYGPYSQTGLMVTNEAVSMITPKMMKKKPPAFAANTGMIGTPTTLSFV